MANEFKIKKGLIVTGASGGTVVDIQGSQGQLFSVTDDLSGDIFAVSDISGVPIFTVNSSSLSTFDGLVSGITPVNAANFVTKAYADGLTPGVGVFLPLTGGTLSGPGNLTIEGTLTGTTASFNSGTTNVVASFISTDSIAGIKLQDSGGNVELSASGNTFQVQPAGGVAALSVTSTIATFTGTITANGGIDGLTLANGGITGTNFDITGVNQLVISDPGEGIVFTGTATMYLNAVDDATDSILKLTNATQLNLNSTARITNLVNPTGAQDAATKNYVDTEIGTIPSGLAFEGNWNASTDTPTLSGTTQDNGKFWIVTVAGSTSLSGITDWEIGDWAIYVDNGAGTDAWQKVDNSSTLSGLGEAGRVAFWSTTANVSFNTNFSYDGTNLTVPRLRVGDGTDGYFYSDTAGRTAFSSGDFYIQSSVGNFYNYATNNFHGGPSGDNQLFRGNPLSGDNWSIATTGVITALGGNSTEWNTAYDNSITAASFSGTTTKTLTLTQQDGGTLTGTFTDLNYYTTTANFNTTNGIISFSGAGGQPAYSVDIDGRYAPIVTGGYLPLSAGSSYPLTGDLYISQPTNGSDAIINLTSKSAAGNSRTSSIEYDADNEYMYFKNAGTTVATMTSGGNVGIGVTGPNSKFEVLADLEDQWAGRFENTNSGGYGILAKIAGTSSDERIFEARVGTSTKMIIKGNGNVGIGETSPLGKLHIKASDTGVTTPSAQGNLLVLEDSENGLSILSSTAGAGYINFGDSDDNDIGMIIYGHSSNSMDFWTNASKRMVINSAGAIKFNAYDSTNNTGTPTYLLGTDASGNVVKTLSSSAPGSLWAASGNNIYNTNSANVGIGTTGPLYPLNVAIPYAKTSTGTQQFAAIFTTNEAAASHPFGLRIGIVGAATIADRYAALQTTDYNEADDGNIVMQAAGGNVGIGTTSPNDILHVSKTGAATKLRVGNNGAYDASIYFNTSTDWSIGTDTSNSNSLTFGNSSAIGTGTKMVIETGGNVGIGTTGPDAELHVQGSSDPRIDLGEDTNNKGWMRWNTTDNYIDFSTREGATYYDKTLVLRTGKVGIGTTSPNQLLEVANSAGGATISISTDQSPGSQTTKKYLNLDFTGYNNDVMAKIQSWDESSSSGYGYLTFSTRDGGNGLSQAMIIDRLGNVGIGTTSPVKKLVLDTSNSGGAGAYVRVQNEVGGVGANVGVDFATFSPEFYSATSLDPTAQIRATDISNYSGRLDILVRGQGTAGVLSTVATFDRSGNVGIGTTSPGSKLVVAGGTDTSYNDGTLKVVGTIALNAANNLNPSLNRWALRPRAAGVEGSFDIYDARHSLSRLTIVNSGNVGIGEASPTAKLEVFNSGGTVFNVTGSQGQLFSVTDNLSGSIFAVSDISGVPIFDVNSSGLSTFDGTLETSGNVTVKGDLGIILEDNATGNALNQWISYRDSAGTERAYVGYGSTGNSSFYVVNYLSDLMFYAGGILNETKSGTNSTFAGNVRALGQSLFLSNSSVFNKIVLNGTNMQIWSGAIVPSIEISSAGLLKLGSYALSGTGTPTSMLGVDNSGNVVAATTFSTPINDQPAAAAFSSGTIVNWSVSESTTAGLLYVVKSNGGWTTTDADVESRSIGMLGIALSTDADEGMLLQGFFYKAAHGFTIGLPLYISNTAGAITTTRPTGSGDYVRIIGYATSTNYIYFDPDKTWVKLA